jgi:hypothetical protein
MSELGIGSARMPCPICQELKAELDRLSGIHFHSRRDELAGRGKVSDLDQRRRQQSERLANLHKLDALFNLADHERKAHPVEKHFTAGG